MKPPCPNCRSPMVPQGDLFWCKHCRRLYDDDPDEGGTHHDRDPARRMVRDEERRERRWR